MPFNGSGTFALPVISGWPAVSGAVISSTAVNSVIEDLVAGLTAVLPRDGQSAMTGNLGMGGNLITNCGYVAELHAADMASAATVNIGAAVGRTVFVTGTTTITSFGTVGDGVIKIVRFTGALTLTHNATSLILPGGANITTAAGDALLAMSLGAGNWVVLFYQRAAGYLPLNGGTLSGALTLPSDPAAALHAATKQYVDTVATGYLALSGGTLTGALTLSGAPTVDLHAATKKYVDDSLPAAASDTASGTVELATSAEAQAGTDTTRAVTPAGLKSAQIITQTSQATTSGTYKDFTGVPAWVDRITVTLSGVSTNGTNHLLVQIGAGSITSSGYESNSAWIPNVGYPSVAGSTAGFISLQFYAATAVSGAITLTRHSGTTWVATGTMRDSANNVVVQMAGVVTLGGTLDRVRLTTVGGTDTFDAGSVNVSWE